jgi:hypothetical protein
MQSRSLFSLFIFVGILLFGLWLGVSIVTDQIQTLVYVIGGATLIICALLGKRIWLILPFAGALNLTLMIPGQPTTLLLAQLLFIGFCFLQFLVRRLDFKIHITELEIWILLVTICVAQAYARNPVGLNILGGESIGARPYGIFAITLFSVCILSSLRVPANELRWIIRLSIIGGLTNLGLSTVGYFFPRFGVWLGSVDLRTLQSLDDGAYGVEKATRIGFLGKAGQNIALWISSAKSPIRACFHPLWGPLVLISIAFATLSGYRSEIGMVGLTYMVGIIYRGGMIQFFIACFGLVIALSILAVINMAIPLPNNIQRSLSFLPGTWDETIRKDAEDSTQWRLDMWEAALFTDYWIQNKLLGDGLGMTIHEFNFIKSFENKHTGGQVGTGKLNIDQELMMAAGNYHSGPINSVRAIGYLGLTVLLLAQIRIGVHAHRQIKRARGTEWYPLSLFIGIPIIWTPIYFVFIFGDFGPALASYLIGTAMIRLLENNLPLPPYVRKLVPAPAISNPTLSSSH